MSTNLTTKAIILRRTNYKEADRILTVLTPDDGQLSVVARGVRKEKSRLAGGIELFAECTLGLVRSSMNIDGMWTLTSSHIDCFYDNIMADYDRLSFGYEAIKQINNISRVADSPELYDKLCQTFVGLNNSQVELPLVKIWFYLQAIKLAGNDINLITDTNGMKLIEDARYNYNATERSLVFSDAGQYDALVIKLLRVALVNDISTVSRLGGMTKETVNKALNLARSLAESYQIL